MFKRFGRLPNSKGFTLIELLVVIAILGVLASTTLVAINPNQRLQQARDSKRKSDLRQVATALEAYYTNHGFYPSPCTRVTPTSCDSFNDTTNWVGVLATEGYLKRLPLDPINTGFTSTIAAGKAYFYVSETVSGGTAGQYYILGTWLENTSDRQRLGAYSPTLRFPDCTTNLGFHADVFLIRSYKCATDPAGSL